jgi:FkbM family methyltransferase
VIYDNLFTQEEVDRIATATEVFEGEYEHSEVRAIPARRILDVGGSRAPFAIWACRYWPEATIDSYEPNPAHWDLYEENVRAFGYQDRCTLIRAGIGETARGELHDLGHDHPGFTTTMHHGATRKVCDVDLVHPATIGPFDIVKLDCEGAECHFLTRYKHWKDVRGVVLEWHGIPNRVLAEHVLHEQGFTCVRGFGFEGRTYGTAHVLFGNQVWRR